ncbi:aromatic ring-hydroxylating oxygenase subunit alpha [Sphingomonas immobilis]|uniref:Aromatic ring-hydroxylating dioxygenase subunit alpha n=1 Tax=Sphingomonas immobilis TaxID=3063997 RepID=A0ABT8ZZK5_9SPHN|nr:aromatic ring-hydroxylating dioxygenase subunit alpha [Sphingomonas sp. CA1-15]MDO7842181.1 aromatic ring-hydroxylating dioxygenase subunit alpha [Sphingomonas sp. CA1-15]
METLDGGARVGDAEDLFDPPPLKPEPEHPPLYMRDVLARDPFPPPANMFEDQQAYLGSGPIPASRYFSRDYAALEKEKMWSKVWQFACWGHDIPNPGDIHVYRILDRSVLVVRQRDGSVKAFVNACLHRGRELCETHTHQNELKCPYHYFTWGLDGSHKWTPAKWDFPQLDEKKFSLPEIRVEEWNGFLFVNFDTDAPNLASYMGSRFLDHWKGWDFSNRYKAVHVKKTINCNWKAGMDAFIEGFHAFASHSQGAAISCEDIGQFDIYDDAPHMSRFILPLGMPSFRLDPRPDDATAFEYMCAGFLPEALGTDEGRLQPGEDARAGSARVARKSYVKKYGIDPATVSDSEALDAISYFMFPNFMPWPTLAYPLVYRFTPLEDPDWCVWETMLFHPFTGERPPSCAVNDLGTDGSMVDDATELGGLALVLHQDDVQLPAVQRGMKNLASGELILTETQELRIRHLHKVLEDYINR